ncbi:hypothetical protein DL98DRAFT_516971 [Cadophora sp. DSE1049]|nr:hypothetical protein DL98DRAFT_516971 [Cadophora sp. DSE1049]
MSLAVPAVGFGTLSIVQDDGILSNIFRLTVRPLKSVDLPAFPARIRAVLTPVLNTNVLHVSRDFTAAATGAVETAITSHGAILRLSVFCLATNVTFLDENITLTTVNSIDWTRFTEISFEYPRTQALLFPKEFPVNANSGDLQYHFAKALTPSLRYPTMPILEIVRDHFYLTINTMTAADYHKQYRDIRPNVKDPNPCNNRYRGCKCSVTKIQPIRVQTGISGPISNFIAAQTGNPQALNFFVILALPVWESGCIGHTVYGCGPVPIDF